MSSTAAKSREQTQDYTDTLTYNPGEVILFPGDSDSVYRVSEGLCAFTP